MNIRKSLDIISQVFRKSSDKIKFNQLTKESLSAMIEDQMNELGILQSTALAFKANEQVKIFDKVQTEATSNRDLRKYINVGVLNFIAKMPTRLKGKSRAIAPMPLGAITHTSTIMKKLLEEISKNVDSILDGSDGVVINETKISQGLFLGVLKSAEIYTTFTMYLVGVMSNISTGRNLDTAPKFMYEYIEKHADVYIDIINQLCNVNGRYSIINDITSIKGTGVDFRFEVEEGVGAAGVSKAIQGVLGMENIFLSIFSMVLRPIALIGEVYVDIRHDVYSRMKERKAWLESHVAMLALQLGDADEKDEKYVRIQKLIDYYTERLAKYEKKLAKYYEN